MIEECLVRMSELGVGWEPRAQHYLDEFKYKMWVSTTPSSEHFTIRSWTMYQLIS